jgi:hypothetical protein
MSIPTLTCGIYFRYRFSERSLQSLHQKPCVAITHSDITRPLSKRAEISTGFEKTDFPRPNAGMFREIDPESNNGGSHRNSSSRHHIEREPM